MLQHTLDRASALFSPERILTVINERHARYWSSCVQRPVGEVLEQPCDRGTASSILLPLSMVLKRDPQATVFLLFSDHFVYPEKRFRSYVNEAMRLAEKHQESIVLLGAQPDGPEPEYGWIKPGATVDCSGLKLQSRSVEGFCEKPGHGAAEDLYAGNWLWNTMLVAVKAQTLWRLAQSLLPAVVDRFETLGRVISAVVEKRVPREHLSIALEHTYRYVPSADFSRDIVQAATEQCLVRPIVLPMLGVHWSDWGHPERIVSTLSNLRRTLPETASFNVGWSATAWEPREALPAVCFNLH